MVIDNLKIKHKAFGVGVVTEHVGRYVTVQFSAATKKFVYPDAFESFLTLEDGTVPEEIKADIVTSKAAKQVIIDRKNEENLRAMTRGIVIPGKEATSNEGEDEENRNKESEEF